jgi:hypothetical protein
MTDGLNRMALTTLKSAGLWGERKTETGETVEGQEKAAMPLL